MSGLHTYRSMCVDRSLTYFFFGIKCMPRNTNGLLKFKPEDDGKTHINIFSRSKCQLGKMLSHFYPAEFHHPTYGIFANMECFWYYVSTGCKFEALRNLPAIKAKFMGRTMTRVPCDDFMEQIKFGNKLKIIQHSAILDLFRQSSLPFEHYYLFGPTEILYRPIDAQALIDVFEEIRTEFIETKPWLTNSHHLPSKQDHQTS